MHTFFWSGPFSQWYKSPFVADGKRFVTAEQYMMYHKAVLFGDLDTAEKIMQTENPRTQKQLGRQVKNFDQDVWTRHAKAIVYKGNYAKFSQNPFIAEQLFATAKTKLVEASPHDAIWGIGLDEQTARSVPPDQWPGKNWLGEVLTYVRDDLLTDRARNCDNTK